MPKDAPLITLTRNQLEEVVVSAGCLSNESLNDLLVVLSTMRLVRRANDPDWGGPGTPLHHVIMNDEAAYVIGIKITNCPNCIRDMLGENDVDEEDQEFSGS